ncbi:MAG: hypothetical protein ABS965_04845 [Succiniclasticum sp.]
MPKPENIEVIKERRPHWEFLQKLPKELHGFTFKEGGEMVTRHELLLGVYENVLARRRLELVYTKETFDYVPVRQVGLHRYRDFRYITRDKDIFEEWITGAIDRLVEETMPTYIPRSGHLLKAKGILDWHYPDKLPDRIGNFVKFIGPQYPLDFINNATIILNYADFDAGNELVVMYNRVRNEYYAENKRRFIPSTIHEFDAKKLEDLESLLEEKLEPYLLELGNSGK